MFETPVSMRLLHKHSEFGKARRTGWVVALCLLLPQGRAGVAGNSPRLFLFPFVRRQEEIPARHERDFPFFVRLLKKDHLTNRILFLKSMIS